MNFKNSLFVRLELLRRQYEERKKTRIVYKKRDGIILGDFNRITVPNRVNLHYWKPADGSENLGDFLSSVVLDYLVPNNKNIDVGG